MDSQREVQNDKLISSMVSKVVSIIDMIRIRVKNGVAFAQEKVSGQTEPDPCMNWVPEEQSVAIALLRSNVVQLCQENPSEAPCKNPADYVLREAIMSAAEHWRLDSSASSAPFDTSPSACRGKKKFSSS